MSKLNVGALRPENHFDTIACGAGVGFAPLPDEGEAGVPIATSECGEAARSDARGLEEIIAALCGGRACHIDGAEVARRLVGASEDGSTGVVVARPLELGADGRLRATPLRQLAKERRAEPGGADAVLIADDALVNPWLCRPLQMGFDVAVEDLRPWLGLDACALVGRTDEMLARACDRAGVAVGDAPERGGDTRLAVARERLATLSLATQRRCDAALTAAHFLVVHPDVAWVSYPGLPDDTANDAARRVLEHGFGLHVSFGLAEGLDASTVLRAARRAGMLACLEGVERPLLTHRSQLSAVSRAGSVDVLVLRAGLETPLDIVQMLEGALGAVRAR
ncbi:MAG: PLP-dependent transferase [Coriobacteriia bacterium]|nr:PLP-dependent transferase [Coriobacteriia bacterium]MBS5478546.1 PLP-dependent transferase [Coriobacteriia bacterium]